MLVRALKNMSDIGKRMIVFTNVAKLRQRMLSKRATLLRELKYCTHENGREIPSASTGLFGNPKRKFTHWEAG